MENNPIPTTSCGQPILSPGRNTRRDLTAEIDKFLADTGMKPTQFGALSGHGNKILPRLRACGDVNSKTVDSLRDFMDEQRARIAGEAAERAARDGGAGDGGAGVSRETEHGAGA